MLTPAQLVTLKAAIMAETSGAFVTFRQQGATGAMAEWINGTLQPNVIAWKTAATANELDEGADYSAFDSVAAGKRDAWSMFLMYAPRDMSKGRNRKVVTDVWGNATAASIGESVLLAATRKITRGEDYLGGSATGTTGTVTARNLTWEGYLSNDDIVQAINLP
jgi:hypothetical protein